MNLSQIKPVLSSRHKLISSCVSRNILIDELIHRMGRTLQSKDGNRQKRVVRIVERGVTRVSEQKKNTRERVICFQVVCLIDHGRRNKEFVCGQKR